MKVYIVLCENSPELALESGDTEIINNKVFYKKEDALECIDSQVVDAADEANNYFPVPSKDSEYYDPENVTLQYNGDEDSYLWYRLRVKELDLV